MIRHKLQGAAVALVLVTSLFAAACIDGDRGCASDAECTNGRVCFEHACTWVDDTALEPQPAAESVPVQVVGGGNHSCARDSDGVVYCWGRNEESQVAPQLSDERVPPRRVRGLPGRAVDLALGTTNSCAALDTGAVYCWGGYREVVNGSPFEWEFDRPTRIEGVESAVELSGEAGHTCARLADGSIKCWGANSRGQLGGGERSELSREPVEVLDIRSAVEVSAGRFHTCARLEDDSVYCWGLNSRSQLGDGTSQDRLRPSRVAGLSEARGASELVDIEAGGWRTHALTADGSLYGWGNLIVDDGSGGSPRNDQRTPRRIEEIEDVTSVSAGGFHMCALRSREVYCWGDNHAGELGDGTEEDRDVPAAVIGLRHTRAIGVGDGHSCAIGADDRIRCWGSDRYGEISGTDEGFEVYEPVEIAWPPEEQDDRRESR